MTLAHILRETLEENYQYIWGKDRTPILVGRFGVCLHTAGLPIRETITILDLHGIDRSHGAVCN
jgi:hypothetical protein